MTSVNTHVYVLVAVNILDGVVGFAGFGALGSRRISKSVRNIQRSVEAKSHSSDPCS